MSTKSKINEKLVYRSSLLSSDLCLSFSVERLKNFSVSVGTQYKFDPSAFKQYAYIKQNLGRGETRSIYSDVPVHGRYVAVHLNGVGFLTLCEVQVRGVRIPGDIFHLVID